MTHLFSGCIVKTTSGPMSAIGSETRTLWLGPYSVRYTSWLRRADCVVAAESIDILDNQSVFPMASVYEISHSLTIKE